MTVFEMLNALISFFLFKIIPAAVGIIVVATVFRNIKERLSPETLEKVGKGVSKFDKIPVVGKFLSEVGNVFATPAPKVEEPVKRTQTASEENLEYRKIFEEVGLVYKETIKDEAAAHDMGALSVTRISSKTKSAPRYQYYYPEIRRKFTVDANGNLKGGYFELKVHDKMVSRARNDVAHLLVSLLNTQFPKRFPCSELGIVKGTIRPDILQFYPKTEENLTMINFYANLRSAGLVYNNKETGEEVFPEVRWEHEDTQSGWCSPHLDRTLC
jgi:hypothetical protein